MDPLKILFVSPEVVPFAKTGGLADVAGSLPKALKGLGCDVRLVMPLYQSVRQGKFPLKKVLENLPIPLGDRQWLPIFMKGNWTKAFPFISSRGMSFMTGLICMAVPKGTTLTMTAGFLFLPGEP